MGTVFNKVGTVWNIGNTLKIFIVINNQKKFWRFFATLMEILNGNSLKEGG